MAKAESRRAAEAALELFQRKKAAASLLEFTKYTMPTYSVGRHHRFIATKIEQAAQTPGARLILTVPPRHGKSQLASRHLPAWFLGRFPQKQVICACYNADFASEFGRDVRNIVQSQEFKNVFPEVTLAKDSRAAERWHTNYGGSYLAAGVGTGITGRGAHLGIIDDPIKGREDADSKLYRDRLWNWYRSVLYTRLMPGASIILCQTRWHDDDLAGRLIEATRSGGDQWELVALPALALDFDPLGRQPGAPLWPEWYPVEVMENIRKTLGQREWAALYQQNPIEDQGAYFKRAWIEDHWYDRQAFLAQRALGVLPLHIYGSSDYAVSEASGDYTVHVVVGVDGSDNIYVLDLWRQRTDSDVWVETVIDLMDRWKPFIWGEESGQIDKSVGPFLVKRMKERRVYCRREQYSSVTDKAVRARAFQARMAMGKVFWPKDVPWMEQVMHELTRFPAGVNDDVVDALSLLGRMLNAMSVAPEYKPPPTKSFAPTTMKEITDRHKRARKSGIRPREAPVIGSASWGSDGQDSSGAP